MGFDEDNLSRDVLAKVLDFVVTDTFEASRERLRLHHELDLSETKLLQAQKRAVIRRRDVAPGGWASVDGGERQPSGGDRV